jgi:acetolactate synthase-1/2/3 large subunit
VIALPEDMLTDVTDAAPLSRAPRIAEPAPEAPVMKAAMQLLEGAERPLILIAGTNWTGEGRAALQRFAEASDIPVVAAFRYQDQFDNHSPVFSGDAGVGMPATTKALIRDADVILAISARFGESSTDGYSLLSVPEPQQTLIHVHPSDREIGKVYAPALGIQAGPNAFARAMPDKVTGDWGEWRAKAREAYEANFDAPAQPGPVDMVAVMAWLRDNLPGDAILANGGGNFAIWPNRFFRFGPGQRLLAPQSGSMGYGVPAAVAAKVAHPERTVVCFAGDGDFQMTGQELSSAKQAGACPIVLVLNNGTYGTIRAHQERNYPARVSGTTIENPDFVGLGNAYGLHAERVEKTNDFAAAFGRALASKTGALLELAIATEALTPRQTLTQMREAALAAKKR